MKTFVINLDRHPERLASIREQLQALCMSFERISAVDGRTLSQQQLDAVYDAELVRRTLGRELAKGEIGCALSHLIIFHQMVKENISSALVLEDDAQLTPVLPEILESMSKKMPARQPMVCLLTHVGRYTAWGSKKLAVENYRLCRTVHAFCAHGYVINLSAAKVLLKYQRRIRHPIDYWNDLSSKGTVEVRAVVPYVIGHSDYAQHSSIEADRIALSQEDTLPSMSRFIRRAKLRCYDKFIYQLIKPLLRIKKQEQTF